MTHRVLVVEDEPTINQALADRLRAEGFEVLQAWDGPTAVEVALGEQSPEVMILDVMLPGFDGLEVCRRVQASREIPVLMLTARDEETDILVGLGVGADDYLTKPFRMREVVARVRALLRRVQRAQHAAALAPPTPSAGSAPPELIGDGDLDVDTAGHHVYRAGQQVHLTPTEFALLVTLMRQPGVVMAREELMRQVWDWPGSSSRTLDSHIKTLRVKVGAARIRTVHGVGYAFAPTDTATPEAPVGQQP